MQKVQICFRQPEDITEFVDIMNQCEYDVDLKSGKNIVDAKSILGVIAISKADHVELVIHSDDCGELLDKIQAYVRKRNAA
ncbi:HPr family phosphocarrier protein [Clostridium sp. AF19-22AC]|jgi:phosphocarrier protein HPr|uniref:Phosphotransferase system HPr-like phosphotransfer protein n=1 Tax=Faecalicatena orotica TaxID=1544 RepID=A0A2Y9BAG2_9FIRM|nr:MULTISPECIES: HPr family phosphocarrier protein [Clostridia]PWJ31299.1 phosphotransferase system HPr-like phosphotransfer protein [Faecalicatena orotica]RHR26660.1 HPr family phosphocarrier protein [Clostridium sp. AF19-22AC]SSA54505.1 Phosphotransferase system, HPr [Faecalicatena orotica]